MNSNANFVPTLNKDTWPMPPTFHPEIGLIFHSHDCGVSILLNADKVKKFNQYIDQAKKK